MNYELQFTRRADGACPATVRVNSELLPRVGDSIELDSKSYDVVEVWHVLTRRKTDNGEEMPCLAYEWVVRAK